MKNALVFISASRDWMESRFMFEFMRIHPVPGWNIATCDLRGHSAADRHNSAFNMLPDLEKLWGINVDKILFMDSDQFYPADYFEKMFVHEEPVVGAYSVSRYPPYEIGQYINTGISASDCGRRYPKYEPMTGENDIFECDAVGLGAAMFDRKIIDESDSPWFKDIIDSKGTRLLCDDFYFFWKLNKKGYRVVVDKNIMIGHYTVALVLPSNRDRIEEAHKIGAEYAG